MPTRQRNPFLYFISNISLVVCRCLVFPFEPYDGAALCFPCYDCAPSNVCSSIQSEQTSNEWGKVLNLRSMWWSAAVLLVTGSLRLIRSSARPYWLSWNGTTGKRDLISMGSNLAIWPTPVLVGWIVRIRQWHVARLLSWMVCLYPRVLTLLQTRLVCDQLVKSNIVMVLGLINCWMLVLRRNTYTLTNID